MSGEGQHEKDSIEFQVAKILISYLQVVSIIRDVDMRLPKPVQALFQVCRQALGGLLSCMSVMLSCSLILALSKLITAMPPSPHHPSVAQLWPAMDLCGISSG